MAHGRDETQILIAGLREGEVAAMTAFVNRYHPALERLADANIAPILPNAV